MDCHEARPQLIDLARGAPGPAPRAALELHLAGCPACRRALEDERALERLLRAVPRPEAPARLRRRLARLADADAPGEASAPPAPRRRSSVAPALAAALALALGVVLVERVVQQGAQAEGRLTEELVNDHLRVLASQRPEEVASGGPHQVKPWFEGRLDFAPVVPAPDIADLALHGGAVGYVLDRRAALLHYTLRLHRVTLLVVRADGLPWPAGPPLASGARGFQVVRWRAGELGYALVSDVNAGDLSAMAASFQAATGR